jgi:hypothetical protein
MPAVITVLPEPKAGPLLYTIDAVSRTLAGWARAHAIPKTTLYSRVIQHGMSMADAIKLGSRSDATAASAVQPPPMPHRCRRHIGYRRTHRTKSVATTDPRTKNVVPQVICN